MPFLYRLAVTINRKQPYIDWANSFADDGPRLTAELGRRDAIYLVPAAEHEQTLDEVLAVWWQDIFEEELAGWMRFEQDWPSARTREMFDAWFEATITDSVVDLAPEEPLTDDDMDALDLDAVVGTCAWCGREFGDEEAPRAEAFRIDRRDVLQEREGRPMTLLVEQDRVVTGLVTARESEAARRGDDLVFRVCNRDCAQPLKKLVPPALRQLYDMLDRHP